MNEQNQLEIGKTVNIFDELKPDELIDQAIIIYLDPGPPNVNSGVEVVKVRSLKLHPDEERELLMVGSDKSGKIKCLVVFDDPFHEGKKSVSNGPTYLIGLC